MGSKVIKRACLLPPIQEWATCLLTEPDAGSVPTASPALGLCLPTLFITSQPKDGLFPCADRQGTSSKRQQHSLMTKYCHWTPRPALEAQLNG